MPRLICISPNPELEGSVINIYGRTTIGREDDNTYVLNNASISGTHCSVEKTKSGWLIRDLMSTNGTFAGGKRIDEHTLKDGEKIKIGKLKYRFELTIASQESIIPIQTAPVKKEEESATEPKPTTPKPANESVNEPVDKPVKELTKESDKELNEKLVKEPVKEPVKELVKESTKKSTKKLTEPETKAKEKISEEVSVKTDKKDVEISEKDEKTEKNSPKKSVEKKNVKPKADIQAIKRAARHAAHSSNVTKKQKNKEQKKNKTPTPITETPEPQEKTGRGLFALLGGILLIFGFLPFLKVNGNALFFYDSFKDGNADTAMLFFVPLGMGFLIFLCSLVAKHFLPLIGGLFVMLVVLTTSLMMFKVTTPESIRATIEGSEIETATYMNATTGTSTNSPTGLLQRFNKITLPDGNATAKAIEMPLLTKDKGILKYTAGKTLKDLFMIQIIGIIIMLGMCSSQTRQGFSSVLTRILALIGGALFLSSLFVPLQDGSMLFGQVASVAIALFYIPLVLISIFCIISNMASSTMLSIGTVLFWIGLPLCPAYTCYAAWRSDTLIPYLQYVRLLGPHYIVTILAGFAIGRITMDASGISDKMTWSTDLIARIHTKLEYMRIRRKIQKANKSEDIFITSNKDLPKEENIIFNQQEPSLMISKQSLSKKNVQETSD